MRGDPLDQSSRSSPKSGVSDVAICPGHPRFVFAARGNHVASPPWSTLCSIDAAPGGRLYRSQDSGRTDLQTPAELLARKVIGDVSRVDVCSPELVPTGVYAPVSCHKSPALTVRDDGATTGLLPTLLPRRSSPSCPGYFNSVTHSTPNNPDVPSFPMFCLCTASSRWRQDPFSIVPRRRLLEMITNQILDRGPRKLFQHVLGTDQGNLPSASDRGQKAVSHLWLQPADGTAFTM